MGRLIFYAYGTPIALALALKFLHVVFLSGGVCESDVRLDGKVAVVTGANTGIGRETALDFARRGARVYLASRSEERTAPVVEMIRSATGNEDVHFKRLDLARISSITAFAEDFVDEEERLDILVNNAGLISQSRDKTDDGFEVHMGVNHLGPFLLTNLLLDLLKQSGPGARVVTVAAKAGLLIGEIDLDDLMNEKDQSRPWITSWEAFRRYSHSKLANILFSKELAKRLAGTGVTTYSLHPGVIQTEIGREFQGTMSYFMHMWPISYLFKTPDEGAQTQICCAVDPALARETGLYYSDCGVTTPNHPQVGDDALSAALWEKSERLVGLKKDEGSR